jgi:protein required for attachment to host cells
LEPLLNEEGQYILRQDIKYLEYGVSGENNIAFELKNSHIPMYIIHDVYLERGNLSAQIDYLIFTKKLCFVIECKNLYGNIEINNNCDFIRTIDFGNKRKREGIYSPITQNQRHMELLKQIVVDRNGNILTRLLAEKYFDNTYKSIVVLANPKTVLNAKFAKKEIKEKVIRADQLVKYIKYMYNESKEAACSEQKLQDWAQSYLNIYKPVQRDYTEKYMQYLAAKNPVKNNVDGNEIDRLPVEETAIFKELKAYRLKKSREEGIKPYFIYNDNQLKDLISKMPGSKSELMMVYGIGQAKADKYGKDILDIVLKYI